MTRATFAMLMWTRPWLSILVYLYVFARIVLVERLEDSRDTRRDLALIGGIHTFVYDQSGSVRAPSSSGA